MRQGRISWGLLATVTLLSLTSCQRGPVPVGASGKVELDGKPVPEGMVVFEPLEISSGQLREAKIVDGQFALPSVQGLPAGSEYRVLIKAFRKTGRKYPAADPSKAMDEVEQYLPAKYNSNSELRAKFGETEAENQFTFELQSAG